MNGIYKWKSFACRLLKVVYSLSTESTTKLSVLCCYCDVLLTRSLRWLVEILKRLTKWHIEFRWWLKRWDRPNMLRWKKKFKRKEYINDKIFIGLEILSSKWVKTKKNNKVRWSTFSCWLHWRIQYYPNCGILLMCLLLVQKPVSIQKSLTRNSKIFLLLNYYKFPCFILVFLF